MFSAAACPGSVGFKSLLLGLRPILSTRSCLSISCLSGLQKVSEQYLVQPSKKTMQKERAQDKFEEEMQIDATTKVGMAEAKAMETATEVNKRQMATSQLEVMANEMITLSMEKQIKNQATQIEALKREIIGLKAINQSKLTPEDVQVQGQMAPAKLAEDALHYEQAHMVAADTDRSLQKHINQVLTMITEESPEAPSILIIRRRAMEEDMQGQKDLIKALKKEVAIMKQQMQKAQYTKLEMNHEMGQSKSTPRTRNNASAISAELRAKLFDDDYSVRKRTRAKVFQAADDYFKCRTRIIVA